MIKIITPSSPFHNKHPAALICVPAGSSPSPPHQGGSFFFSLSLFFFNFYFFQVKGATASLIGYKLLRRCSRHMCMSMYTYCMILHTNTRVPQFDSLRSTQMHLSWKKNVQQRAALIASPVSPSLAGGLVQIKVGYLSPQTGYNWVRWSMR